MYPVAPTSVLSNDLVRTGLPVAALLWTATVLIVGGLFSLRASRIARRASDARR